MNAPRIAVTMGDPAGVGPEVCLRAWGDPEVAAGRAGLIVGDAAVLHRVANRLGLPMPGPVLASIEPWSPIDQPLAILNIPGLAPELVAPGCFTADTGRASYAYIQTALDLVEANRVEAIVTGPINKEALHAAGIPFPGHTEIFAAATGTTRYCMMQYSERITCTFVTVHVGYAEVPALVTRQRVLDVIELTADALQRLRGRSPRIAVCGLNPHAGENGLFGVREEEREIVPAVEEARRGGLDVVGPLPPDTVFVPDKLRQTDAVVCMYHDQGHIPVKALAFDSAVNTTLGLPIVRTSVDHGTAGDIAWQGRADPGSMAAAIRLATRLVHQIR